MAESKSKVFHAKFYVRWAMIEALMEDFETDTPSIAAKRAVEWGIQRMKDLKDTMQMDDDEFIEVSFEVDYEGLELLMKDFQTDDPITALQYTLDWVTVEYFTSQIEGKLKLDGFDDEGNPKVWRDESYNSSCSRIKLLN